MSRPKGWNHPPETIEKMREVCRASWQDPEVRRRRMEGIAQSKTPELKKQTSEGLKSRWSDPVFREKMIERQRQGQRRRWANYRNAKNN